MLFNWYKKISFGKDLNMKQVTAMIEYFFSREGTLFRYSLSYGILLGIFPCLFLLIIIVQNSVLSIVQLIDYALLYFPEELIVPFVEYLLIKDEESLIAGSFSFIAAIYVSSQSIYSFLLYSANEEKVEVPAFYLRVRSILIFLCMLSYFFLFSCVLMVFSLNHPFVFLGVLGFGLYGFYRSLSFYHQPWQYGLFASVLTSLAIGVMGILFFWIIENFISVSTIYGPLFSLLLLFLSSSVLGNLIFGGYCILLLFKSSSKQKKWMFAQTKWGKALTAMLRLK